MCYINNTQPAGTLRFLIQQEKKAQNGNVFNRTHKFNNTKSVTANTTRSYVLDRGVTVPVLRKKQQNMGPFPSLLPHTTVSASPSPTFFFCCPVFEKIKCSFSFSEYQAE